MTSETSAAPDLQAEGVPPPPPPPPLPLPHLCWRCELRLKQPDFALLLAEIAAAAAAKAQPETNAEAEAKAEAEAAPVCSACLGVLQTLDSLPASVCDRVAEAVSASGHEFSACRLLVSTPIASLLRDRAWGLAAAVRDGATEQAPPPPVQAKDVWKALAKRAIESRLLLPAAAGGAGAAAAVPLQVSLEFRYPADGDESRCLGRLPGGGGPGGATRHGAAHALELASGAEFRAAFPCPPPPARGPAVLAAIEVSKDTMYVGGRYRKLCRRLPQTPWILDGERRLETSVEELISPAVSRWARADSCSFASSGREDVDVRMLGRGRPFLLRLQNPRASRLTQAEAAQLQAGINAADGRVQVSRLRQVGRADCEALRAGENEKVKCYSALCRCLDGRPIAPEEAARLARLVVAGGEDGGGGGAGGDGGGLVLEQATPVRVLHRRTAAVRRRRILSLALETGCDPADPALFRLRLRTEAGAYVKEFVHGDLGRTRPCLGDLLGGGRQCDLLLLDVVDVELDWPAPEAEPVDDVTR